MVTRIPIKTRHFPITFNEIIQYSSMINSINCPRKIYHISIIVCLRICLYIGKHIWAIFVDYLYPNCSLYNNEPLMLTHWGRVTHICVIKLTIIGPDNGLSPGRRQAIIWINAAILLIGPLETNFSGILSEIHTFSFKKMHLKMSSGKWRPFCLGLNVLILSC